jgi:hypothetical protein
MYNNSTNPVYIFQPSPRPLNLFFSLDIVFSVCPQ